MTEEEWIEDFEAYLNSRYEAHRFELPYKTGNLRDNSYKLVKTSSGYEIYLDLNVAPYAEYIDRPGYKTEKYWDIVADKIIDEIIEHYST